MSQVGFKSVFWCLTAKQFNERVENTFIWADNFPYGDNLHIQSVCASRQETHNHLCVYHQKLKYSWKNIWKQILNNRKQKQ